MFINCELCERIRCRSVEEWYYHLVSPEHQQLSKSTFENSPPYPICRRMVLCVNFSSKLSELNLIDHFGHFGLVHDIYFNRYVAPPHAIKNCVVQMDSEQSTNNLLQGVGGSGSLIGLEMKGSGVYRRRTDMPEAHWENAIGINKTEIFLAKHQYLTELCSSFSTIRKQFEEFMQGISLNATDELKRQHFLSDLQEALRKVFPHCKLKPFGSYATGLGDCEADIDVYIDDVLPVDNEELQPEDARDVYEKALNALYKRNRTLFKRIVPIRDARVPIIRLMHVPTKVQADLTFTSRLPQHNTKLLKFYIDYDPRVKPFLKYLRYWGQFHKILGCNMIKTYALMLMGIVSLNQQWVVPSVHFLQKYPELTPKQVDGWNVAFMDSVETVRKEVSNSQYSENSEESEIAAESKEETEAPCEKVLLLLKEFFRYYGSLDFDSWMVCTVLGTCGEKKYFEKESRMQAANVPFTYDNVMRLRLSNMVVQDPFILDFNVASAVRPGILDRFQTLCKVTENAITTFLEKDNDNSEQQKQYRLNIMSDTFIQTQTSDSNNSIRKARRAALMDSNLKPQAQATDDKSHKDKNPKEVLSAVIAQELKNHKTLTQAPPKTPNTPEIEIPELIGQSQSVCLEFTVSDQFRTMFLTAFGKLRVRGEELETKLQHLWSSYVGSFFDLVWQRGFNVRYETSPKYPFKIPQHFDMIEASRLSKIRLPYNIGINCATGELILGRIVEVHEQNGSNKRKLRESKTSPSPPKLLKCVEGQGTAEESQATEDGEITESPTKPINPPTLKTVETPIKVLQDFTKLHQKLRKITPVPPKPYYRITKLDGDARPFFGREEFGVKKLLENAADPLILNINSTMDLVYQRLVKLNALVCDKFAKFDCEVSFQDSLHVFVRLHEAIPDRDKGKHLAVIDYIAYDLSLMFHQFVMNRLFVFLKD